LNIAVFVSHVERKASRLELGMSVRCPPTRLDSLFCFLLRSFMADRKKLFKLAKKAHAKGALMSASISTDGKEIEAELSSGLVVGHAYGVTDVRVIEKLAMMRLRNP